MTGSIVVKIQPLTPLWTGDVDHRGGRVRDTGILGSLRWWYEALLRGLGHYACDPTSGTCSYADQKQLSAICLACQLFGCTGYGRRFRLMLNGGGDAGPPKEVRLKHPGTNNHRGWRIPPNLAPSFTLTFVPLTPGGLDDFKQGALLHTLRLIEPYGALGAKTSHGQGVIRIIDQGNWPATPPLNGWKIVLEERDRKNGENLRLVPNLADFVGAFITLNVEATSKSRWWEMLPLTGLDAFGLQDQSLWIPSAPAVRARLRDWLRNPHNIPNLSGSLLRERHRLMGTIRQPVGPKGSDVFVTHLYRQDTQHPWTMRIFGFVPRNGSEVDEALRALLQDGKRLASEVAISLGEIPVGVTPYPSAISMLLEGPGGEPSE